MATAVAAKVPSRLGLRVPAPPSAWLPAGQDAQNPRHSDSRRVAAPHPPVTTKGDSHRLVEALAGKNNVAVILRRKAADD